MQVFGLCWWHSLVHHASLSSRIVSCCQWRRLLLVISPGPVLFQWLSLAARESGLCRWHPLAQHGSHVSVTVPCCQGGWVLLVTSPGPARQPCPSDCPLLPGRVICRVIYTWLNTPTSCPIQSDYCNDLSSWPSCLLRLIVSWTL